VLLNYLIAQRGGPMLDGAHPAMRLEFSGPLSRKRLAFFIQAL
jgi:hypothetical protein